MTFNKMSHLKQRLMVGGLAAALIIVAVYLSPYPYFRPLFALAVATIVSAAVWEFYDLARQIGFEPLGSLGIVCSVAYIIAIFLGMGSFLGEFLPQAVLASTLFLVFAYYLVQGTRPFANIAATLFAIVYITIPLGCLESIIYFFNPESGQDGRWWFIYVLAVTKMTDTGAFFCGRKFGRIKITPHISPRKTLEGAIGGFLSAVLTSFFLYSLVNLIDEVPPMSLSLWQSIWLGSAIGLLAQFGDLCESLLKREGGVKDSSQLPGLGGVLDVVDSLIFTAPFVYLFLKVQ